MPKRTDIQSILIIGAGPIVIGQACEFDYSGVQAVKALKEEGYRVILVNSNPATIMTDPDLADATYVEPITPEMVAKVIEKERPDALLPTMGGQTALNCALELDKRGVLDLFNVEMIGAKADVIDKAENRERFRNAMDSIGLESPKSRTVHTMAEAEVVLEELGLPAVIRPSFTMGGTGGGIAYNVEEFREIVTSGLYNSPVTEVLIEESVLGWKEYEMEVVRDKADNCIIICSIENIDPMGVHTGDSITVAPALTLTDKEYQRMRSASIAVLREIGVETGGSNVQFAVNPADGRMVVIEMNPRVSRSSALASKATGFPIAKVAAKLAVGYTLDEIDNDITGGATPASFEPTIDYVVTKIPRFAFEKYPGAQATLTTSMKSVGEAMAMGRSFSESVQKALRSLETGLSGFDEIEIEGLDQAEDEAARHQAVLAALSRPTPDRLLVIAQAFREGLSVEQIHAACSYEPWFLRQIETLIHAEDQVRMLGLPQNGDELLTLKSMGFSDKRLATLAKIEETEVKALRKRFGVRPVYKRVDTCAAEFSAPTPYMYSSYERGGECESQPTGRKKAIILGGGPNRIGQGIEFDYCCCHAAYAFAEMGIESIMVNCNPETVSTDYDTADRLYFEPLTAEDVLELIETEMQSGELLGVVVQYGGQTPLKLAPELEAAGVPILGTAPDAIDLAEDRERFKALLDDLKLKQPPNAIAHDEAEARQMAEELGFPLVLRPSHVLGGRGMEIVRDIESFSRYIREAVHVSGKAPLLLDRYLSDASEVDVDAVCDGENVWISGIMEHIEEAGVHSGDSACSLPPHSLSDQTVSELRRQTKALAKAIDVKGLMNVQYAVKDGVVYLIEVNPRASRTVPFVAKTIGAPVAKIAAKVMAGAKLTEFDTPSMPTRHIAVKEAVMPFSRFPGVDPILGPEMRSTGEVMGIDERFEAAFAKAELGAGVNLPKSGTVFISLKESDKAMMIESCHRLTSLGFKILATTGTAKTLEDSGVPVQRINKVFEGRPHIVDAIKNGEVQLVFNTTEGQRSMIDSYSIRRTALEMKVPCYTTASASRAAVKSIAAIDAGQLEPRSLQSYRNGPSGG
ncbi:MAG: carbamoyl phosphate synthase large subunit [Oceanicaulis sp.]|uniref:carbamoyl-phosphate synthase large subunit n=2 Tax=unclassified Oceanicaulis TaxID=2632123 RepID=UPI000C39E0A9|nr:carbamoyl-phosphate synthase large subunit [Oceanicaulis sp.]MBC40088.1 carbamoyl phosphate synthase large subunit [Oceanicaulis sp.]MBG35895.1 carbamoyl phosphate synthase large subunit [Oceanicaulis sp.]